jgi:CelD/BcsL family acetyltransferase involved in cellulose biosynthesis
MNIDQVEGRAAFLNLEPLWEQVCREQRQESFFLSHRWFRACLAGTPTDVEPIVLIIREGGSPVGLVPLLRHRDRWRGLPTRVFSLATNQDAPFGDFILPQAHPENALAAVMQHFARHRGWHLFVSGKIRRPSPTHALLSQILIGQPYLRQLEARVPVLELSGGWDLYWTARSQRFKKTVRNVANRIERLGTIDIRNEATGDTAAHCLEVFRTVAAKSWKATLPISITRNAGIARFFDALTTTLCETDRLALWVLRLDGVPIATEYHVRDGRTVYALRSDFDDAHRGSSPGAHLNAFIIRAYFDSDVAVYDMGPGDREYKQRWATSTTERDAFWLFNRAPYATALYAMERRAVPQLRRLRAWWRGPKERMSAAL